MVFNIDTEINQYSVLGILQELQSNKDKDVTLNISSLGGSFDYGLKLYYQLLEHSGGSVSVFKGRCASAATIFAQAAKKRKMYQNSLVLIHKVLTPTMVFKYMNADDITELIEALKDQKEGLNTFDYATANIYYNKAKEKGKSHKDILNLMSKDKWLTASEALEWGLIDEIIQENTKVNDKDTNALINKFNLPELPKIEAKTRTNNKAMNLKDTVKNFFKNTFSIDDDEATDKANDLLGSINTALKNHIDSKINEAANTVKESFDTNEIESRLLKLENKKVDEALNFVTTENLEDYKEKLKNSLQEENNELKEKIKELKNSFEALQNKISEVGTGRLKDDGKLKTGGKLFEANNAKLTLDELLQESDMTIN